MLYKILPFAAITEWEFKDPDIEGHEYRANSKEELLRKIAQFRQQNGLEDIDYLPWVVEDYNCRLQKNLGKCGRNDQITRSFMQYIKGGILLLKNLRYPKMVNRDVAQKRADVCITCPQNVFPDKGPFIKWSDRIAEASTGGVRVVGHDKLGNCAACSCPLRAKVWYGGPLELSKEELEQMPDVCWQKREFSRK